MKEVALRRIVIFELKSKLQIVILKCCDHCNDQLTSNYNVDFRFYNIDCVN